MHFGNVKWYRRYSRDPYDHSKKEYDFYVLNGNWYVKGYFKGSKKFLISLFQQYPEIVERIENQNYNRSCKEIDKLQLELFKEFDKIFVEQEGQLLNQ